MMKKSKLAGRFSPAFLCETHPAVKILVFILMAIYIPRFQLNQLVALALLLSAGLIYFRVSRFFLMLRRMRWFFISMLIIYSYTTPGQYLANWPIDLAPTYEGISQGLFQIAKVCLVLAGIALLMATSTKETLMAGIFVIIRPLKYLGLDPERFAARLFLTLHYIESRQAQRGLQDAQSTWQHMLDFRLVSAEDVAVTETISLDMPRLGFVDYLCVTSIVVLMGLYL